MTGTGIFAVPRIGFSPERFGPLVAPESAHLVRLIAQHRDAFEVDDGQTVSRMRALPKLKHLASGARPVVGDFAWAAPYSGALHIIALLPRYSVLKRASAGERYCEQLLAANIDAIFILCGLDADFNVRRIERYLALTAGSACEAVVVLTKMDLGDPSEQIAEAQALLPGVPLFSVNAKNRASLVPLLGRLGPGKTGVLVGSSGVGKSTLSNTLLGRERQQTGETRASDGKGRHTTVHRQLLVLPEGGCLIDSPGLREVKLLGDEPIESQVFPDIEALSEHCRFSDCSHHVEPGCAVLAAIERGELLEVRYLSFLKLREERAQQAGQLLAQQRRAGSRDSTRKGRR